MRLWGRVWCADAERLPLPLLFALIFVTAPESAKERGRALRIEDYRLTSDPSAARRRRRADGGCSHTVSTRLEEDNGTKTERWLVRADASPQARRVVHEGKDVSGPRWADDNTPLYTFDEQASNVDPENPAGAPIEVDVPTLPAPLGAHRRDDRQHLRSCSDASSGSGVCARFSASMRDSPNRNRSQPRLRASPPRFSSAW